MSDLIDRQEAIDAVCKACCMEEDYHKCDGYPETSTWCEELVALRALPSAQPNLQPTCNQLATDTISRQAAIDLVRDVCNAVMSGCESWYDPEIEDEVYKDIHEVAAILKCNKEVRIALRNMPSAQPEIIRCKDCKYYEIAWLKKDGTDNKRYKPSICVKGQYGITRNPDWFCADAERRTDE